MNNEIILEFDGISANEAFARVAVAAFITPVNPTLEELADVKTAVSEAVTNAIIHGYDGEKGKIVMHCMLDDNLLHIEIQDMGRGIEDIEKAMEPLYTTKPELERSGMGFSFMEAFMDEVEVVSEPWKGTCVTMRKAIGGNADLQGQNHG